MAEFMRTCIFFLVSLLLFAWRKLLDDGLCRLPEALCRLPEVLEIGEEPPRSFRHPEAADVIFTADCIAKPIDNFRTWQIAWHDHVVDPINLLNLSLLRLDASARIFMEEDSNPASPQTQNGLGFVPDTCQHKQFSLPLTALQVLDSTSPTTGLLGYHITVPMTIQAQRQFDVLNYHLRTMRAGEIGCEEASIIVVIVVAEAESAITLCHDNVTAIVRLHIKHLARLVWMKVEATTIE
ncbi:hypothetical protein B0H10DRAFT_1949739 [Mycena sp. CBHHK59/15]|nr:hypothetical protein B0H10DRAFT_1949739 [Mycena sp. CBHHK59/15]